MLYYSGTLREALVSIFSLSFVFGIKVYVPPLMNKIKHIMSGGE